MERLIKDDKNRYNVLNELNDYFRRDKLLCTVCGLRGLYEVVTLLGCDSGTLLKSL